MTAWRISKTPEFEEEYRQARYEAVGQSFGRLNQGTGAAATVLLKIMLDPTNSAASRVHAADRVIQHSKSHLELEDFNCDSGDWSRLQPRRRTRSPSNPLKIGCNDLC